VGGGGGGGGAAAAAAAARILHLNRAARAAAFGNFLKKLFFGTARVRRRSILLRITDTHTVLRGRGSFPLMIPPS
jgi:hypothetical protein